MGRRTPAIRIKRVPTVHGAPVRILRPAGLQTITRAQWANVQEAIRRLQIPRA